MSKTLDALTASLLARGEMFHGGVAADIAADWADYGFTAAQAAPWMDLGVWDAATAADMRDSGVPIDRIREAADELDRRHPQPWPGAIYAACNGDLRISAILILAESLAD